MTTRRHVDEYLPLRPAVFGILIVLRGGPRHGYGIMQDANLHVGHQAVLGPGTLYRTLKELRHLGLIEHTAAPRGGADARRQYYRLTELGDAVGSAEEERLRRLIAAAPAAELAAERTR